MGNQIDDEKDNDPIENAPAAAKHTKGISSTNQSNSTTESTPILDWADDYILSDDEVDKIADPTWLIENLIIQGHIVLLPAEPNGGKTTIMFHLAGVMAQKGIHVFYVNVDISPGDVKPMVKQSKTEGFTLMLPDMMKGKSIDDVIDELIEMANSEQRFDNTVFIFDTLKKMLNVINKKSAKGFFQLFRKLSALGMTVIFLGHTNKYPDNEGKPIYEGTGDMRSDVDELIFFIPQKHDDKSMTVSTLPDKVRGNFMPISFKIDPDRNVSQLNESVDTIEAKKIDSEIENDTPVIQAITEAIESGSVTQKEIISFCSDHHDIGERKVKKILPKYCAGPFSTSPKSRRTIWKKSKGDKNSYSYSLIQEDDS